jgi:large subunit ribosomal protein L25
MAKEIVLEVEAREGIGKTAVTKLRHDGFLPGVIYGKDIEPQALAVPHHELIRILKSHGVHALVSVRVKGGREYLALVKDVQVDVVKQIALHVDFHRVREDEEVHTESAIEFVGTSEGVKLGGILDVQLHSVAISALPRAIPENIPIDISAMQMGDVVRVSDLVAPEGVTILTDAEQPLASVVAPRTEEAAVALTEEEAAALAELSAEDLEALQALKEAEVAPAGEEGEAPAEEGGEAAE